MDKDLSTAIAIWEKSRRTNEIRFVIWTRTPISKEYQIDVRLMIQVFYESQNKEINSYEHIVKARFFTCAQTHPHASSSSVDAFRFGRFIKNVEDEFFTSLETTLGQLRSD